MTVIFSPRPEPEPESDHGRKPTSLCPRCRMITWTGDLCLRCKEAE